MRYLVEIFFFFFFNRIISSDNSPTNDASSPRTKRYLVYPKPGAFAPTKVQLILGLGVPMEVDVSLIIGYVMKFNYVLPYNASYLTNPYVRYDRSINRNVEPDENDELPLDSQETHITSRWELYDVLALALGSSRSGKACLLKAICEAAATSFRRDAGLASQLLHLFLTPSSTSEPFRTDFDRVYRVAEIMGRQNERGCDSLFPECSESLLEYFTEVHE